MRVSALGFCALLIVGAACGGGSSEKSEGRVAAAASPDDLEALLIDDVPADFDLAPEGSQATGPSDLEEAIRETEGLGLDARALLVENGFVRGHERLWRSDNNEQQIIAFLYQFEQSEGARHFVDVGVASVADSEDAAKLDFFEVDGIPGATGLTGGKDGQHAAIVVFSKGPYSVQFGISGPEAEGQSELVADLAQDQYARL